MDRHGLLTPRIRNPKTPIELSDYIFELILNAELAWDELLACLHYNFGKPPLWEWDGKALWNAAGGWKKCLHAYLESSVRCSSVLLLNR